MLVLVTACLALALKPGEVKPGEVKPDSQISFTAFVAPPWYILVLEIYQGIQLANVCISRVIRSATDFVTYGKPGRYMPSKLGFGTVI